VAFAGGYSKTIAWYSVDPTSGALTMKGSLPAIGNSPSFLAWNRAVTNLYAVEEATAGRVASYSIDKATGALTYLNDVSSAGNGPAHVSVDATGKWVFAANYGDGTVAVLPVQSNGSLGAATDTKAPGANAHMAIASPSNKWVFVPCLGADLVAQYALDAQNGKLTPNATPTFPTDKGAGPRHLAFHTNGKLAFLLAETASTVTSLAFDDTTGQLTKIATYSTLAPGFSGANTGAEIWVHPTGKWVFTSNRGDDSIAAFSVDAQSGAMTFLSTTKTTGTTPRDFTLDPSGAFLYAANQGSDSIIPFDVTAATGALTVAGAAAPSVTFTQPSFVGVANLPGK
jgi:6-phosphogluconolactonase